MNREVLFWILAISASLAVIVNGLLIFVVYRYSSPSIGNYKWLLVAFAVFEGVYATIVFFSIPIHLINDNSWIVFSYESPLGTWFWGPGLYCTFYELWIGLVVVMFIYRWIVVCHPHAKSKITRSYWFKILIFLVYFLHFVYSFLCGVYWCTRSPPSENLDGSFNPAGTASILNHYGLVVFSAVIISFCCVSIWRCFSRHSKEIAHIKELKLSKQIFFTLVLQTIIPLLLCHLPTLIYLTFPFWPEGTTFGSSTSIMSVLTTLPKILDPIVTIVCIHEYRRAFLRLISGDFSRRGYALSITSSSNF